MYETVLVCPVQVTGMWHQSVKYDQAALGARDSYQVILLDLRETSVLIILVI